MADFVQKNGKKQHRDIVQHLETRKTSGSLRNAREKAEQILQRNATTTPQKLPILAKEHHAPMSQKKKKQKAFCKPGSMSAYREFRKKQLENKEQNNDLEASMVNEIAMVMTNPSTLSRVNEDENANDLKITEDENVHEFEVEEDAEIEAPRNKKHRGPTKLPKVHARTTEERKVIILNSAGQPVGPTQETVDEFSLFLGTVARDPELAPLNYRHFPSLPTRDKIWDYILEKYLVPDEGRKWVMKTINTSWRGYKCRVKKNHYYAYKTDALRWEHRPKIISESQFKDLSDYWDCSVVEEESNINKDNRGLLNDMHTMGPKSYASLRYKLQQEDSNKQEPSQGKVYRESRRRIPGKTYSTSYEETTENIVKMDALDSIQNEEGNSKDPYFEVIKNPKRNSQLHLYGKGVTKNSLKKRNTNAGFIFPQEFIQSMQTQLPEEIAQSVASMILSQIREANPELNIVIPNFQITPAPRDESSAPNNTNEPNDQSCSGTHSLHQVNNDANLEDRS